MSDVANPIRGETSIVVDGKARLLRPTFDALVRAEEELGSLFDLVERAGAGKLQLAEVATLFWHCLDEPNGIDRHTVGEAILAMGMAKAAKPLRALLTQILKGAG